MYNDYNTRVTLTIDDMIRNGVKIWDFDYPSYYKGQDKTDFEQKVLDHYRFRQIGQETVGRFLHYFRSKIREIMPYYIQLYESVDLYKSIEDPFESYSLTEEYTRKNSSKAVTKSTNRFDTTENTEHRHSDTPQGSIDNLDKYVSDASRGSNTSGSEGANDTSTDGSGLEEYTLKRYGNIGVQPLGQELRVLRESFLNIDVQIIDELKDLFLKVY